MSQMPSSRALAQKSVTAVHPFVPRCVAIGVPIAATIAVAYGGRDFATTILFWGAVVFLRRRQRTAGVHAHGRTVPASFIEGGR